MSSAFVVLLLTKQIFKIFLTILIQKRILDELLKNVFCTECVVHIFRIAILASNTIFCDGITVKMAFVCNLMHLNTSCVAIAITAITILVSDGNFLLSDHQQKLSAGLTNMHLHLTSAYPLQPRPLSP